MRAHRPILTTGSWNGIPLWRYVSMFRARMPQWWVWGISAFVWLWLLTRSGFGLFGNAAADLGQLQEICSASGSLRDIGSVLSTVFRGFSDWGMMVVAMMFPLQGEAIAHVAYSSPWYRRQRAIAMFLLGYLLLWLTLGLAIHGTIMGAYQFFPGQAGFSGLLPVLGFAIAALWTWHPARRRALVHCGRTVPLRTNGWGAELDCLRFGLSMGGVCLRTCWPPMVALMLAQHGLGMMLIVAGLMVYERFYLTHKSKLLGYAWGGIALFLLLRGLW